MTTMRELINAARAAHGLPPYAVNARLAQSAQRHAVDIAGNPVHTTDPAQYHIGTDGSTIYQRIRDTGYDPAQWSEVTGWGFGGDKQAMLNWWLNSPTHRGIILSTTLTECGIALIEVPNSEWRFYWCIDFGRPKGEPKPQYEVYVPMAANDNSIDLLDYIRGDGRMYDILHADGSTETFQTQRAGDAFWQVKNHQWEHLRVDGGFIWRGVDTSPGALREPHPDAGRPRAYIQWESGYRMARWCPRFMTVGQTWTGGGHHVEFRFKDDCSLSPDNSGTATNKCTLVRHINSITFKPTVTPSVTVEDVIELYTHTTGETMFYARDYGLVAWRNASGQYSQIVAMAPGRDDLIREEVHCFD